MAEEGYSGEPPRKKARQEPQKVKIQFKAPGRESCEIAIYGFWLSSSEFFEAKFERWTKEGDPQTEPLVLDLPQGCQPEKGAAMLKRRLAAAEVDQEAEWDSRKWWGAAQQDEEALFAAVCSFDLLMMPGYSKEVADALSDFRLDCPMAVGAIAKRHNDGVTCWEWKADLVPIDEWNCSPFAVYKWFEVLSKGSAHPALQELVDRVVYGVHTSPRIFFDVFLARLTWLFVQGALQNDLRIWVEGHLKRMVVRRPVLTRQLVEHFKEAADTEDRAMACASILLHTLFIESSRDRCGYSWHRQITKSIRHLSEIVSPRLVPVLKLHMLMPAFAIASTGAQWVFAVSLGEGLGQFMRNHVHLLHPENRPPLLEHVEELSEADIKCLNETAFPQQAIVSEGEWEEEDEDEWEDEWGWEDE